MKILAGITLSAAVSVGWAITASASETETSLPSFVPSQGRQHFAAAVEGTAHSSERADVAAQALSEKFSDVTTGSISANSADLEHRKATPPSLAAADDKRSIVLTLNKSADARATNGSAATSHGTPSRISPVANPKYRLANDRVPSLQDIGSKVSFMDRLTNPVFWFAQKDQHD